MNNQFQNNAMGYFQQKNNSSKKMNLILYAMICILVVLIVFIFLIINGKFNNTTRTFMIYMVGADLESKSSMGTYELEGLDYKKIDLENMNVVLIAGGSTKWANDYISKEETSIYQLTKNGFQKVKQQDIKNMGDSATLSGFLNFVTEHYITDKYELLFWNHGGAILGSEYDELNNNDNLSLIEISSALKDSSFNKNNKIDTVIFSTCLNGTIENANIFKNYADYFVASEEISMSVKNTSDFSFINDITVQSKDIDIGKGFISKYKEKINYLKDIYKINNSDYNVYSTYSIINLNNIDNLNNSVDDFFGDVDLIANYNKIAKVRSNLYQYAYDRSGEPNYDMVDLYNLIFKLKDISPIKANKVLNELNNTIIYNYSTDLSSRGISIYFPYNGEEKIQNLLINTYDDFSSIDNYNKFISNFSSLRLNNSANKLSFKNNSSSVAIEDKEADFELELTEEQINNFAKAEFIVFRDNNDGYFLPVYRGKEVILNENKLEASIKDRQLRISDDTDSRIVTLIETESKDNYIKYEAYAVLEDYSSNEIYEWKNDSVILSIVLDKRNNNVKITEALLRNNNGLPNRIGVDINQYSHLLLGSSSYKILDDNNEYIENWSQNSNRIFEGIEIDLKKKYKLELENYSDEYNYYCTFQIYDVNNNSYYSPLVKMK